MSAEETDTAESKGEPFEILKEFFPIESTNATDESPLVKISGILRNSHLRFPHQGGPGDNYRHYVIPSWRPHSDCDHRTRGRWSIAGLGHLP